VLPLTTLVGKQVLKNGEIYAVDPHGIHTLVLVVLKLKYPLAQEVQLP